MDSGPGWLPDPEDQDQECYWSGSAWTGRVRPAGKGRSSHLPEHVPELQRALAAATADIEAVEERLSNLFDRTEGRPGSPTGSAGPSHSHDAGAPIAHSDDEPIEFEEDPSDFEDEEGGDVAGATIHAELTEQPDPGEEEEDDAAAFAELDAPRFRTPSRCSPLCRAPSGHRSQRGTRIRPACPMRPFRMRQRPDYRP
jgi:hypothetical protein